MIEARPRARARNASVEEQRRVWRDYARFRRSARWEPKERGPRIADTDPKYLIGKWAAKARRYGATVIDLTIEQWQEKLADGYCYYCGSTDPLEIEHMTPLSRGGQHTSSNVVASCRDCNSKKRKRTAEEFLSGRLPYAMVTKTAA